MPPVYDSMFKLLLIGDRDVGKTSLVLRFADDTFRADVMSTLGVDFKVKTVQLEGKTIKLQIWDTAGQERFQTITTAFYRGAKGVLLVYDVTDQRTFENIRNWISRLEEHGSPDVEKIIVGNKADTSERFRQVSKERGEQLAIEYGMKFMETSARLGENVDNTFLTIASDIMHKMEQNALQAPACQCGGQRPQRLLKGRASGHAKKPQRSNRHRCGFL